MTVFQLSTKTMNYPWWCNGLQLPLLHKEKIHTNVSRGHFTSGSLRISWRLTNVNKSFVPSTCHFGTNGNAKWLVHIWLQVSEFGKARQAPYWPQPVYSSFSRSLEAWWNCWLQFTLLEFGVFGWFQSFLEETLDMLYNPYWLFHWVYPGGGESL
jgi:hypothetical protein